MGVLPMDSKAVFTFDVLGMVGIVLTLVLLVLDKAGKLKGGWLVGLLFVAGVLTLALAVGNSFVLDAPSKWRVWRALLMFSLVAFTYSGIAIWISDSSPEGETKATPIASSLTINAYVPKGDPYPDNYTFAGILWLKFYTDVRLDIVNGPAEVKDVDFQIKLDTSIAGIGQISQFSGISAFPAQDAPQFIVHGKNADGTPVSMPIVPMQGTMRSAPVYRVHCDNLLADTTVHLAIASVAMNPLTPQGLPETLFAPRRSPKTIQIKGHYSSVDGSSHPLELQYELPSY
jgi:hypothetical protein